jgi:hypothetical protein
MYSLLSTMSTLSIIIHTIFAKGENVKPAEVVTQELGVRPLARQLGIAPSTVGKWKERTGGIPSVYHKRIIELAEGRITADDLVFGR